MASIQGKIVRRSLTEGRTYVTIETSDEYTAWELPFGVPVTVEVTTLRDERVAVVLDHCPHFTEAQAGALLVELGTLADGGTAC